MEKEVSKEISKPSFPFIENLLSFEEEGVDQQLELFG
jgi:hypothetical protein